MPRTHNPTRVFAFVLLIALAGSGLIQSAGVASPLRSKSAASDNDVQVIVTTQQNGITRSITTNISVPGLVGRDTSAAGAEAVQTTAAGGDLVISEIYSQGGNTGSAFQNNYLELFNRTNNAIDISGWKIYLTNSTGTFNIALGFASSNGILIGAHKYFLIKFGPDSSNGSPVPWDIFVPGTPIIIPGFPPLAPANLSPAGKVFITVPDTNLLGIIVTCPLPNAEIIDFVGYGGTANCFEGAGPAPALSNTTAAIRKVSGCIDTNNNAEDFVATEASPHNRFSAANNCPNLIDNTEFFVRQHYSDFLNRVSDADGLAYWSNEITSCGADAACIDIKRINVSAAFFLSIEFQETGYLVERCYKTAYGDADGLSQLDTPGSPHPIKVPAVRFSEFLTDSALVAKNLVVGQPGWPQLLENNKVSFTQDFVTRARFISRYPTSKTPTQFVNELYVNTGVTPSANELASVIAEFSGGADTSDTAARARALRRVAENAVFTQLEKNRAFVLMQYFGYLRRNPNDPPDTDHTGFDFWLAKLNQFNGNFVSAQMVKAFLVSTEYRQRFGL
jgi:hypothetical protein